MLHTRLWMGALLVLLAAILLVLDQPTRPFFPFLLLLIGCLASLASLELTRLLPGESRPRAWFCLTSVLLVLLANWPAHVYPSFPEWLASAGRLQE